MSPRSLANDISRDPTADETFIQLVGDARKILPTLPECQFASVITSPPYWGLRKYSEELLSEIGIEADLNDYVRNLVEIFREVRRVLRDDGVLWLVLGDAYTSGNRGYRATDKKHSARSMASRPKTPAGLKEKDLIGLPWRVAFALQADGWYLRTEIIWSKPNPVPEDVKDRPHRSHEYVFLLTKSAHYYFDRQAFSHPEHGVGGFRKTVWSVPVGRRKASHPAAFPLEIVFPCLVASSRPNDWILDPFSGSGSVGLASLRIGRRFTGIEIVGSFAADAVAAMAKLSQQSRLSVVAS